jgi:hypothetical protein
MTVSIFGTLPEHGRCNFRRTALSRFFTHPVRGWCPLENSHFKAGERATGGARHSRARRRLNLVYYANNCPARIRPKEAEQCRKLPERARKRRKINHLCQAISGVPLITLNLLRFCCATVAQNSRDFRACRRCLKLCLGKMSDRFFTRSHDLNRCVQR